VNIWLDVGILALAWVSVFVNHLFFRRERNRSNELPTTSKKAPPFSGGVERNERYMTPPHPVPDNACLIVFRGDPRWDDEASG